MSWSEIATICFTDISGGTSIVANIIEIDSLITTRNGPFHSIHNFLLAETALKLHDIFSNARSVSHGTFLWFPGQIKKLVALELGRHLSGRNVPDRCAYFSFFQLIAPKEQYQGHGDRPLVSRSSLLSNPEVRNPRCHISFSSTLEDRSPSPMILHSQHY